MNMYEYIEQLKRTEMKRERIKPSKDLTNDFIEVLDDEARNENDIQKYLEKNSELIPLPILAGHQLHNSVVISKFQLSQGFITDFAYLTKCSDHWKLVLIEIEDAKKKLFVKNDETINFSAEFNHAYDQILSWKAYVDENKPKVKEKLIKLLEPKQMQFLPLKVNYVLVIGRNKEKSNSERKTIMFDQKNTSDIIVKTYDSIISEYLNRAYVIHKIILSPWKDKGFKVKVVPNGDVETLLFSFLTPDDLKVNEEAKMQLEKQGYFMDSWFDGYLLTEDGKCDKRTKCEMLLPNSIPRKILEEELK